MDNCPARLFSKIFPDVAHFTKEKVYRMASVRDMTLERICSIESNAYVLSRISEFEIGV